MQSEEVIKDLSFFVTMQVTLDIITEPFNSSMSAVFQSHNLKKGDMI